MKTLIYGSGVLGSLCAARLYQSGQDVTVLARGQRLEEIRQHGLCLEQWNTKERITAPVRTIERLDPEDAYDLAAVMMGKHQVPAVLPVLAANHRIPNILFMGNNLAGPGQYIEMLGRERVLMGFYMAGGTIVDGVVRYADDTEKGRRKCPIGEVDGSRTSRLNQIAQVFKKAEIPVETRPDMDAWLKTHGAVILSLAGGVYMAGADLIRLAEEGTILDLIIRGMREALGVLQALHVPVRPAIIKVYEWIPRPVLERLMARSLRNPAMQIAFAHGQKARPEMRVLFNEFFILAAAAQRPVPAMQKLCEAV